ncbi:unnamed protein product [Rotaria sp. Silwood2]|nr:unnamed protein product [Rotaria sp. Silwood2]CAF4498451.1 unnamed protein product [Rotaria sp. Silwood2]
MTLSPFAVPFFSCTSSYKLSKRNHFLCKAKASLSPFDFNLFCEILEEWETYPNLHSCFSRWQNFVQVSGKSKPKFLSYSILSFNVRGLDLRWQEVLLLISSFKFDILVLIETGMIDISFYEKIFSNFKIFFQKGENKHGGIVVLVREGIISSRIRCDLPNVCVVDIKGEEDFRLLGVYAPNSKSWSWDDLSLFLSKKCIIYGDFNVDIMQDGQIAESLLKWTDNHYLAPVIPSSATSLRSNRVIDYALVRDLNIDIQIYNGNTSSDHRPVISTIPFKAARQKLGKKVHWKVFSFFSEFSFSFWEENWNISSIDSTYNDYIRFLSLLSTRCTTFFSLDKYRSALPVELRSFLSYIRALSFRQIRTKCSILKKEVLFLKKIAKNELNHFFFSKLDYLLHIRNSSSPAAISFWHKSKRCLKPSSSSIHALINTSGEIIRDNEQMCELAADYYESFFKSSNIIRPHPYTDSPPVMFDNMDEVIPEVTLDELMSTVHAKRKTKSLDAHGIANFMFNFLHFDHWSLLLKLYNYSFQNSILPSAWKDTRIILLAKKEHICPPSLTRPISLLDSFQKVGEKLFLTRFRNVLFRRGLLPDNQSGFRENFRLQTRLLLFLEDLRSLMSNSSPISTIFVDFRTAFDQLWFDCCIGKLRCLGIPPAYLNWIYAWLLDRRSFIEINETKSRWFNIDKGCPQGSVLSPTLFITYNCDLGSSLASCTSHLFADDLAVIVAGQLGIKYSYQCLDLEKRIKVFIDHLEYYSYLTDQPINTNKTQALFTARAIGHPKFDIHFNSGSKEKINWVPEYKYLGYLISSKLGWDKFLKFIMNKVRHRISLIKSFRLFGRTSPTLRKTLFLSFVLPIFTWVYPIFPFLSVKQQSDLSHYYFSSLRRIMFCLHWSENFFAFAMDEKSFEDRCAAYWERYLYALADSTDGMLLFEKANLNVLRQSWINKNFSIKCLRKSKRFVSNESIIETVVSWLNSVPSLSSIPNYEVDEIQLLEDFPESFLF